MRDFKGMKRQRGRNRKPGGGNPNANATNPNRSWDSQGPENIKVRGNAQTVYERYMQLARDASAASDRVLAENYTQHAEHYFRVLRALQPSRPVSEIAQRELAGQGFDIDFEDETGAQAAAIIAAEKAEAERVALAEQRQRDRDAADAARLEGRSDIQPRREWRDRPDDREPREFRTEQGSEGEDREGGRRETRRERWERRQQERALRFASQGEGGNSSDRQDDGGAPSNDQDGGRVEPEQTAPSEATATQDDADSLDSGSEKVRPAARERRPRKDSARPVREATDMSADDNPSGLPGFLTRPTQVASAPEADTTTEAAPRARAPRRRATAPVTETD